jgi:hypothetical protein
MALDQRTFDIQKNIFEHEELSHRRLNKLNKEQSFKNKEASALHFSKISNVHIVSDWFHLSKDRYIPDVRINAKPLEWRVRTKLANKDESKMQFNSSIFLKNLESYERKQSRREFTVWPKNFRTRRMRLRNVRYNRRALLQRRILSYRKGSKIDFSFLSQDRSLWTRKADNNDWISLLDPHSNRGFPRTSTSQSFPLSLERGVQAHHYVPGDLQPSIRGGLVWPGIDSLLFVPKSYYRPGSEQNFF